MTKLSLRVSECVMAPSPFAIAFGPPPPQVCSERLETRYHSHQSDRQRHRGESKWKTTQATVQKEKKNNTWRAQLWWQTEASGRCARRDKEQIMQVHQGHGRGRGEEGRTSQPVSAGLSVIKIKGPILELISDWFICLESGRKLDVHWQHWLIQAF